MTPAGRGYLLVKRLVDLAFITVTLPVVLPLGLFLALLIRIDSPGPVLFAQERTGQHGRRFRMWKFRTMVANAEELKADLAHLNILEPPDFKIPEDPRITRVGRFLRKTSLDELPQLLNLAQGSMTLVGPGRPPSPPTPTICGTPRGSRSLPVSPACGRSRPATPAGSTRGSGWIIATWARCPCGPT